MSTEVKMQRVGPIGNGMWTVQRSSYSTLDFCMESMNQRLNSLVFLGKSAQAGRSEPHAAARESLEDIGSLAPRRRPTSSFGEFNPPAVKPFVVKLAV